MPCDGWATTIGADPANPRDGTALTSIWQTLVRLPGRRSLRMSRRNHGWVVVGVGALITCVAIGAMLALPVFLAPISADTGWSRAGIAFAITLNFLMMGIGSFGWGYLSDRYGARRVVLTGVVVLCIGYAWASRAT